MAFDPRAFKLQVARGGGVREPDSYNLGRGVDGGLTFVSKRKHYDARGDATALQILSPFWFAMMYSVVRASPRAVGRKRILMMISHSDDDFLHNALLLPSLITRN